MQWASLVERARDWAGRRGLLALLLWSVFLMLYQATRTHRKDTHQNARR